MRRTPRPTLFPYTTLFRSYLGADASGGAGEIRGTARLPGLRDHHSRHSRVARMMVSKSRKPRDRKSTRLNSSHTVISYAVFCLKKKRQQKKRQPTGWMSTT